MVLLTRCQFSSSGEVKMMSQIISDRVLFVCNPCCGASRVLSCFGVGIGDIRSKVSPYQAGRTSKMSS